MNFTPITLFCLAAVFGMAGGLWNSRLQEGPRSWKDHFDGMLGGALIGLATSLGLYERIGTTEFGECTLLALSLVFSMAGRAGFQRLLDGLAKLYLGAPSSTSQEGPWQDVPQRKHPKGRWGRSPRENDPTLLENEREPDTDQENERSVWPPPQT